MGKDYKKVKVNFYLRHWRMLEKNRNILTFHEIESARLLFNSLPKLSEKNLKLLKKKYYDTEKTSSFDRDRGVYRACVPINDEVVSYQLDMTEDQYRNARQIAERELEDIMLSVGSELLHSKQKIHLKINRFFYIKSVEIYQERLPKQLENFTKKRVLVDDVILTLNDVTGAKQVFDLSDDVIKKGVEQLERYGFMREALDEYELKKYENEKNN